MNKITEIIPDDLPDWANQAISEGQFFRESCKWQERFVMLAEHDWVKNRFPSIDDRPYATNDEYIRELTRYIDACIDPPYG